MLEMLNPKLLIHEIAHTLLLFPMINTELLEQIKKVCGNCKLFM